MPLQIEQWTSAIDQLVYENFFNGVTLWHNGNGVSQYSELQILNDDTQQSVKPSEADLEAAYNRWVTRNNTDTLHAQESATIQAKATLALDYSSDVRRLLDALIDIDIANNATTAQAFETIVTIMNNNISTAFRNRFYGALEREQNIILAGLSLLQLLGLTVGQKRTTLTYLRIFLNQYALLILWAKQ